jgi:arylsulfatase A-like enzyme
MNGLQVPLILSMPGTIAEGSRYTGLVNLTDLYPTLVRIRGLGDPECRMTSMGSAFGHRRVGRSRDVHREHIYTWYNANKSMSSNRAS